MTRVLPGLPWPLGASVVDQGVNMAVWAPDATAIDWCLFDATGTTEVARLPLPACTDGVWHGLLPNEASHAQPGLVYGLRAQGPWRPEQGHRFNPAKVLLDPHAREVVGAYAGDLSLYRGDDTSGAADLRDNAAVALKARVRASTATACAPRPATPWPQTVLYEVHVKGATQQLSAVPPAQRGTYLGLAHPAFIDHVRALGVTTLSLLPVQARADEERLQRLGLTNYWGYTPIGFCAPEPRYASAPEKAVDEFLAMVEALHAASLEVVLDVVFNHTAETDECGPTLSFRGLANARYYRLDTRDRSRYINWAGCGNVLNLAEPRVVQLVVDSLRHWAALGVDGFRFDLAPILGRGEDGAFSRAAGFFAALQADPVLSRLKLIAEPWDIGPGGYQLGAFPSGWAEWNDRFRDAVRAFWLRDGEVDRGEFVHRWAASSAAFRHDGRAPTASIHFLTAHDGFTLRDLVSYNDRHNEANGEHGRDGHAHNASWNCGVEGPSDDPAVVALRQQLSRALLATLLLAPGTPMLLAGDEIGHSQQGNNNAYCQDNPTTWLDWTRADADLTATVARLLRLRREHAALRPAHWLADDDVQWHEPDGRPIAGPAWQDRTARALAIHRCAGAQGLLVLVNAAEAACRFAVPEGTWHVLFDSHRWGGEPASTSCVGWIELPAQSTWLLQRPTINELR